MKTATKYTSPVNIEERQKADIRSGDTVRVWQKIKEGNKTRLQAFEGIVISRKHGRESGATFTVRKVASGVGTEKIFPLYSPLIDKLEIIKRAKTRRAKLYYIRDKAAREIRKKMRQMRFEGQDAIGDEPAQIKGEEGETEEGGDTNTETLKENSEQNPVEQVKEDIQIEVTKEEKSEKTSSEDATEKTQEDKTA
jgi:large subunit ribosomal protein L19